MSEVVRRLLRLLAVEESRGGARLPAPGCVQGPLPWSDGGEEETRPPHPPVGPQGDRLAAGRPAQEDRQAARQAEGATAQPDAFQAEGSPEGAAA